MSDVSILTLLTNPRVFFESLEERPVSLLMPALFVIATALVSAVSAYQISSIVSKMRSRYAMLFTKLL